MKIDRNVYDEIVAH